MFNPTLPYCAQTQFGGQRKKLPLRFGLSENSNPMSSCEGTPREKASHLLKHARQFYPGPPREPHWLGELPGVVSGCLEPRPSISPMFSMSLCFHLLTL